MERKHSWGYKSNGLLILLLFVSAPICKGFYFSWDKPSYGSDTGCYSFDDSRIRENRNMNFKGLQGLHNKRETCLQTCELHWFKYAGVQNGNTCWCGNEVDNMKKRPLPQCQVLRCSGDITQFCGAYTRMEVMETDHILDNEESMNRCWGGLEHINVFNMTYKGEKNTKLRCKGLCGSFRTKFAAVYDGNSCLCRDALFGTKVTPSTKCNARCSGNDHDTCGGKEALFLMSSFIPDNDKGLGFVEGCYTSGNQFLRPFNDLQFFPRMKSKTLMTRAACQSFCNKHGRRLAGVIKGDECMCGQSLNIPNIYLTDDTECRRICSGKQGEYCGGKHNMFIMISA